MAPAPVRMKARFLVLFFGVDFPKGTSHRLGHESIRPSYRKEAHLKQVS